MQQQKHDTERKWWNDRRCGDDLDKLPETQDDRERVSYNHIIQSHSPIRVCVNEDIIIIHPRQSRIIFERSVQKQKHSKNVTRVSAHVLCVYAQCVRVYVCVTRVCHVCVCVCVCVCTGPVRVCLCWWFSL